jgi:hypothetical protein
MENFALKLITGGIVSFAIAAIGFYFLYGTIQSDSFKKSWPKTTAMVLEASIDKIVASFNTGGPTNRTIGTPGWDIKIKYEYEVNGTKYVGTNVSNQSTQETKTVWNDAAKPSEELKSVLDKYSAGTKTEIHYNPKNPSESFINFTSSTGSKLVALGMGILFSILGVLLLVAGFRKFG